MPPVQQEPGAQFALLAHIAGGGVGHAVHPPLSQHLPGCAEQSMSTLQTPVNDCCAH